MNKQSRIKKLKRVVDDIGKANTKLRKLVAAEDWDKAFWEADDIHELGAEATSRVYDLTPEKDKWREKEDKA